MVKLHHPQQSPRQAFVRGFWRGMAAPMMLFVHQHAEALPRVAMIEPPKHGPGGPQADDWARIAGDFRRAIGRHQTQQTTSAAPDRAASSYHAG